MMFRISYENEWIEEGSMYLDFTDSWIFDDRENAMGLMMKHVGLPLLDVGVTRNNHSNISGFGRLANMEFSLRSNFDELPEDGINITIHIYDISAHSRSVEAIPVIGGEFTIEINTSITSIAEQSVTPETTIWPNPSKNAMLNIASDSKIESVEIINVTGKRLLSKVVQNNSAQINIQNLAPGTYISSILHTDGYRENRIVIVE